MMKKRTPNIVDKALAACSPIKNPWCSQVGVGARGQPHGSPNGPNMPVKHLIERHPGTSASVWCNCGAC